MRPRLRSWRQYRGLRFLGALLAAGTIAAAASAIAAPAPDFSVSDADEQNLGRRDVLGRPTVLLYETRDSIEQNRALKSHLAQLLRAGSRFRVIPVVDCSSAPVFFRGIWRGQIRDHSKAEAVTIYCDWSGDMARAYGAKADSSNVFVLDAAGELRYTEKGVVPPSDFARIDALLAAPGAS